MKLNFQKLHETEAKYHNDPITLNALQTMVDNLLGQQVSDLFGTMHGPNVAIATATLIELGILIMEPPDKPKK